jgi:hypothetical protein
VAEALSDEVEALTGVLARARAARTPTFQVIRGPWVCRSAVGTTRCAGWSPSPSTLLTATREQVGRLIALVDAFEEASRH